LGLIPLDGEVVVGDATSCQRDLAEQVVAAGGDYVLVVKENQPKLQTDVAAGFGYEASQRSLAAAFPPRGPAAGARASGHPNRQGARSGREAHPADDDAADGPRALAGLGARV